ncbi:diguanylate cyclase [Thalassotalea sp. HSM 43]|uniref:GGDEF domain-containing protein n=1 Tax=Thalassotalea sp. HSM 43 TaxID=2552945 RepID=UPI001081012A|nr:GGDEF domain-containing protein [Thalassotalea sp. HSM 43]QBY04454.1 diguanylate cyclase [Thalassotalea sp. HSM 43]
MNRVKSFYQALVVILLFSIAKQGFANSLNNEIFVDGSEHGQSLSIKGNYYLDEASDLTAQQVWQQRSQFQVNDDSNAWLDEISGSVWSYYTVSNRSDSEVTVYFEYPYHQPATLALYQKQPSSAEFIRQKTSQFETGGDRAMAIARVTLPVVLQANESKQILVESYSDIGTARFTDFRLWSTKAIVKATNLEHLIFAAVVTFILLSSLISFGLYKFLKEKFFFWYSLFAVSSIPVMGLSTGILNLYVAGLDYHPLGTISMVVMMAAGIQFIRVYSNASYHSLLADKAMHLTMVLVLLGLPVAIIGFHELAMQIQQIAIFTFPVAIIAAIYCGSLGEKQITTMVLAKLLFFVVLISTNLQAWGWVKPSYGLVFLPTIGMLGQLICLIWAMYSKALVHVKEGSAEEINTINDAYERAFELQEQVKQQNQMLKAAKEQAEFEARTDMLTHLPNRRAFMNLAKMAIAQAVRQEKPLSFIAFDIDNFKTINDQYGHPAGDKTLKEVGDLTRSIIRASDFCGRIGGEEFMIGCHNNSMGDAYHLAERIRKAIENHVIVYEDMEFSTTVSIGLAQLSEEDDLESVIKKADEAMYLSKSNGKNKVTHYAA